MQVVGEADCGRAAIDMVRTTPLDVVLLDIDMPRQGGMDAISLIKAKANELGVIVFSSHPEKEYAVPLIRGGASAYLHKSCDPGELLDAIRKVGNGGSYITPQVADLLATQLLPARGMFPHEQLSSRELQVFLKLARGMAPGEVAQELSLSAKTVSSYRARVLQKLEARSNADLTYYALKHGLLD